MHSGATVKRFDLLGSRVMNAEDVTRRLEELLNQGFAEHESAYLGGIYFRLDSDGEQISVRSNTPDEEGYLPEQEFEEWQTQVYVNGSRRWNALAEAFSAIPLNTLRSEQV